MMPLAIEVKDGEIVSMAASNGEDISPYMETFSKHATIESLFDLLDSVHFDKDVQTRSPV